MCGAGAAQVGGCLRHREHGPARGPQVLKEGEREKTKTYQAVVWVARPLTDADLQTLLAVLRASRISVD